MTAWRALTRPIRHSSRIGRVACTIRCLWIGRGRDTDWSDAEDAIYVEAYARPVNNQEQRACFTLALSCEDTEQLITKLQEEVAFHKRRYGKEAP